jgi:hypothetical protein
MRDGLNRGLDLRKMQVALRLRAFRDAAELVRDVILENQTEFDSQWPGASKPRTVMRRRGRVTGVVSISGAIIDPASVEPLVMVTAFNSSRC